MVKGRFLTLPYLYNSRSKPLNFNLIGLFLVTYELKILLGSTAQGAAPILGQILKIGSLFNSVLNVTLRWAILISAQGASVNIHDKSSLNTYLLKSHALYIIKQLLILVKGFLTFF